MPEFLINTLTHPAFTAAIGFLAGHFLAIGRDRRKEYVAAASTFRNTILTELKEVVLVNKFWDQEIYTRIRNTAPTIRQAAIEFRPTIPYLRKNKFDRIVLDCCSQCEEINWEQAILDAANETDFEETQKGKFKRCVDNLLSFIE